MSGKSQFSNGKQKHPGLVGFTAVLAFLAIAGHTAAFGLPYWYFEDTSGVKTYVGFWKGCVESSGDTTCVDVKNPWEDGLDWYNRVSPGLAAGGILFSVIAFLVLVVKMCKGSKQECLQAFTVAGIFFFISALLAGGAAFVWGRYQSDTYTENFGYCFYAECGAAGLFLLVTVLLALPVYSESAVVPYY